MTESVGDTRADRRRFLKQGLVFSATIAAGAALGFPRPADAGEPLSPRYPDPLLEVLDDTFLNYRIFNAGVELLGNGLHWAEGPVWFGAGRYLLLSDVPNNRIMRWDEITGQMAVYRENSNFSNGLTRDRQGRLIACEGSTTDTEGRRITRTEHDGRITVIADSFEGKRLNSPNDIAVKSDDSIWFSDPPFQTGNNYEGHKIKPELPDAVYRVDGKTLKITRVIDNINGPNGLCFSPDEKILYVVEGRSKPNRRIWAYTVNDTGNLGERRIHVEGLDYASIDGIKCDIDGNLWCGWGSSGALAAKPESLDGVKIFNIEGKAIGHIRLPERCGNLCFGGREGNRLFMASGHSLFAVYVNTKDATTAQLPPTHPDNS